MKPLRSNLATILTLPLLHLSTERALGAASRQPTGSAVANDNMLKVQIQLLFGYDQGRRHCQITALRPREAHDRNRFSTQLQCRRQKQAEWRQQSDSVGTFYNQGG